MQQQNPAAQAAANFFRLAGVAARHGGFWVSAGGGTANVVAGTIARATGVSFEAAHDALDTQGNAILGEDWYGALAASQPYRMEDAYEASRWDARTVAWAAVRCP